ncbi:tripartite tricarboxylate transporter substrate binding protein [Variovorax sp. J22R133]|uniref:Bug family tripartite tricarboxylate transporter substrate binding protein n=1 Tax=Variovorax brevis TaxID=3053503 RepID=UPI00257568EF|nr:tripartite tricarboxylate transporter substrate binding protein [Variovorax sp. J22R133]MDM0113731.1 tripartite tricarboxylate transporter substrate binding protein [Variovorax sp. J22R133]
MNLKRLKRLVCTALLCAICQGIAGAASWPDKPVKLIVQGAAGSGPDVLARTVASHLEQRWKQAVFVVNQPGGGGLIAAQAAAGAEPDGYTLYVPTITTYVILPEMHDKLPLDLERDFTPIGLVAQTPMMIAVAPSLGVASLSDLVALARSRPDGLFYAANNRGSLPHLAAEMWRDKAGAPMTFVPYAGFAAGLQDLLGGRVSMIVESAGAMAAAVQAGSVKALAVASANRLPAFPDVPTVAETIPGFTAVAWIALVAPGATPPQLIQRISDDLSVALAQPALLRSFETLGAVARPMSPVQAQAFIRAEQQSWQPVVRRIGLKTQ